MIKIPRVPLIVSAFTERFRPKGVSFSGRVEISLVEIYDRLLTRRKNGFASNRLSADVMQIYAK